MIEDKIDAVDINFGCPQNIARRGHYGAFLLEETELVCSLIKKLHDELSVPVCAKIRILKDDEATIELVKRIEQAGAAILTVHGRTIKEKKNLTKECNWKIIKRIVE